MVCLFGCSFSSYVLGFTASDPIAECMYFYSIILGATDKKVHIRAQRPKLASIEKSTKLISNITLGLKNMD